MTPADIRRVTLADAPALATLDAACFDIGWDAESMRALLSGELTVGWLFEARGVVVGAVLVRAVAGEGEVLRLAVMPHRRHRGHARALMAEMLTALGPVLPHGLHLEVRASNVAAHTLYLSLGFVEVGRRRAYYVAPVEDAILMHWQRPDRSSTPR